uniref:Transmembrane protein n=1 Tax=Medicago truncatula TaxID=3880 RepID=I3SEJ7_MEDTR|nr:unknown [Medicago truncatula]
MLRLVLYILVIYLVNESLTLVIFLAIYMPANHSWLLFLCLWCE